MKGLSEVRRHRGVRARNFYLGHDRIKIWFDSQIAALKRGDVCNVKMAPKKEAATGAKRKNKVVIEDAEMAPESDFSDMQYPEGVIVG